MVCEYFRHGRCEKGFKCKFSHDLSVERKGPKIDLFQDQRTAKVRRSVVLRRLASICILRYQ